MQPCYEMFCDCFCFYLLLPLSPKQLFFPSRKETTRISQFPKTQYHQNSTVFDVVIHDYNYTLTKSKSRLALEMIVVNGNAVNKHSTDRTVTEDDEYTPSVFTTREYYFRDKHTPSRGFMQWKPVSYQSKSRQSTKSQQANIVFPRGNAVDMLGDTVPRSLASALFSDATPLNGTSLYIVIGDSGDDTYTNSRYMTWWVLASVVQVCCPVFGTSQVSQGLRVSTVICLSY